MRTAAGRTKTRCLDEKPNRKRYDERTPIVDP